MIKNVYALIRDIIQSRGEELFLVVVILLVGLVSFGLGQISSSSNLGGELIIESTPVETQEVVKTLEEASLAGESSGPVSIIGNKNSKIYHRSDCSGAKRMSETNKIYFASIAAAKTAGFRAAANCPGLE